MGKSGISQFNYIKLNFRNSRKFPPRIKKFLRIPTENFWDDGFPGIPKREFPVALIVCLRVESSRYCYRPFSLVTDVLMWLDITV